MNPEDKITYILLNDLKSKLKYDKLALNKALKDASKPATSSPHLLADTVRLDDYNHMQFLNCKVQLDGTKITVESLEGKNDGWVSHIGKLELKRLILDYKN